MTGRLQDTRKRAGRGHRKAAALILAFAFAGQAAVAEDRPMPLPGKDGAVAASPLPCPGGLERYLPGDYYFCRAAQHFWSGYQGLAIEALKEAARWGSKPAQYALGVMYFNGDRVPPNRPLGLAWLALSAERHTPVYESTFVSAYGKLSAAERARANAYWNDMKPTYADAVAAARAKLRFEREFAKIKGHDSLYIDGFGGGSSYTVAQMLETEKAVYFAGYESQVFVGDATLVPIGEAARPAR
jgi:TPR repeat protein